MNRWKAMRRALYHQAVVGALAGMRWLPRPAMMALAEAMGRLGYAVRARERSWVQRNLALALPELDEPARDRLARRTFIDLGRNAAEVCRMMWRDPRELLDRVDVEGEEHLAPILARERGAVVVTGHIGAWELLAGYWVLRGVRVYVAARPLRDPRYQPLIDRLRERLRVNVFPEGTGLRTIVRALRQGDSLGILIDQSRPGSVRGTWAPLFGQPTFTPTGPAEIARLGGVPLMPMAIQMVDGRHRIICGRPIEPDWREPQAIDAAMARCIAALEELIRRAPTQWVWMYDRWNGPARTEAGDGNA
jgi:KDO2-lipid IV(A) lauroyltransferase